MKTKEIEQIYSTLLTSEKYLKGVIEDSVYLPSSHITEPRLLEDIKSKKIIIEKYLLGLNKK